VRIDGCGHLYVCFISFLLLLVKIYQLHYTTRYRTVTTLSSVVCDNTRYRTVTTLSSVVCDNTRYRTMSTLSNVVCDNGLSPYYIVCVSVQP